MRFTANILYRIARRWPAPTTRSHAALGEDFSTEAYHLNYALHIILEAEQGHFAAHELPPIYVINCAVYVTWRRDLETRPDVIGQTSLAYVMPPKQSVDINEWHNFEFMEY